MFFSGCSDSSCLKVQTANTSNIGAASLGFGLRVDHEGVSELLQLVLVLESGLQLGFAGLYLHDSLFELDLVVDEGDVLGAIRFAG